MEPKHRSRLSRLVGFDYRNRGGYFVTTVTERREKLFGQLLPGAVALSDHGRIVRDAIAQIPDIYSGTTIDASIVMPDHIHLLVWLEGSELDAESAGPSLPRIIASLKGFTARRINRARRSHEPVWQHGYFDRVVRNEEEREFYRWYIRENPSRTWMKQMVRIG